MNDEEKENKSVKKSLDEVFDVEYDIIENTSEEIPANQQVIVAGDSAQLPAKLNETQDNLDIVEMTSEIKKLVKLGANAADDLADLAKESQHPRAYESLAVLIKNTTDAAKAISDMQLQKTQKEKLKKEIEGKAAPTSLTQINQTVYTKPMTTDEMISLAQAQIKKPNE